MQICETIFLNEHLFHSNNSKSRSYLAFISTQIIIIIYCFRKNIKLHLLLQIIILYLLIIIYFNLTFSFNGHLIIIFLLGFRTKNIELVNSITYLFYRIIQFSVWSHFCIFSAVCTSEMKMK